MRGWRVAAAAGLPQAQLQLAVAYELGIFGLQRQPAKALRLYGALIEHCPVIADLAVAERDRLLAEEASAAMAAPGSGGGAAPYVLPEPVPAPESSTKVKVEANPYMSAFSGAVFSRHLDATYDMR